MRCHMHNYDNIQNVLKPQAMPTKQTCPTCLCSVHVLCVCVLCVIEYCVYSVCLCGRVCCVTRSTLSTLEVDKRQYKDRM